MNNWDKESDRDISKQFTEVNDYASFMQIYDRQRIPYIRKDMELPSASGVKQHSMLWNNDTIYVFRQLMNTDDEDIATNQELDIWNKFVEYQDKASTSSEYGATNKDEKNYSYPILIDGSIDKTTLALRATKVNFNPFAVRSLDMLLSKLVTSTEYVVDMIEQYPEDLEAPFNCSAVLNAFDELEWQEPDNVITNVIYPFKAKYLAHNNSSSEYENLPPECVFGVTIKLDPCTERPLEMISWENSIATSGSNPELSFNGLSSDNWIADVGDDDVYVDTTRKYKKMISHYTIEAPTNITDMTTEWFIAGWNKELEIWDLIDKQTVSDWTSNQVRRYNAVQQGRYDKVRVQLINGRTFGNIRLYEITPDVKKVEVLSGTYNCSVSRELQTVTNIQGELWLM